MKKKLQALFIPLFVQLPVHDTDMSRKSVSVWEDIREKGKLIVLTRHAPMTYYHDDATQQGFEYELTQQLGQCC